MTVSRNPGRLDSWKEIATYLNRGLSTVQRWEQDEGLPVHRHQHAKGGSVFAYAHELDAWWNSRRASLNGEPAIPNGSEHEVPRRDQPGPPTARRRRVAFAAAAVVVLAAPGLVLAALSLGAWGTQRANVPARTSQRLSLELPADAPLAPVSALPLAADKLALALSPDGRTLVYSALRSGRVQLVAYDITTEALTPLAGTEEGFSPFFSPSGTSLGFFAKGRLWTTPVTGGRPTALANTPNPWGGAWGRDGMIFFNAVEMEGLFKVDVAGRKVEPVLPLDGAYMPEPLAPGSGVLAHLGSQIVWVRHGRAERTLLNGIAARVADSGHLVYAMPGILAAAPFDAQRVSVSGPGVVLANDLRTSAYGVAQFALSHEGTLVYVPGADLSRGRFVLVDRDGKRQRLPIPEGNYRQFSLSPDGTRLAVSTTAETLGDAGADIWIYDLAHGAVRKKTPDSAARPHDTLHLMPKWAPDGDHLVYCSVAAGRASLVWSAVNGSERTVLWTIDGSWLYPMSFSPDGSLLSVFGSPAGFVSDLFVLPIRRDNGKPVVAGAPVALTRTKESEALGQFSPDGRAIVYISDASGRFEAYVRPYPVGGPACRVSDDGALDPSWMSNGREILYQRGDAFYSVALESIEDCRLGARRKLFDGFSDRPGFGHDSAPGGRWLLVENDTFTRPATTLKVITNVFDELRRRLPAAPPPR